MIWISIDPGVNCGWAVWEDDILKASGRIHNLECEADDKDNIREKKVAYIRKRIGNLFEEYLPEYMAIERPYISNNFSSDTILTQIRIWGVIIDYALVCQIPIKQFAPTTVKKAITGSGSASKELVQAYVKATFGEEHKKYADQADAVAIGTAFLRHRCEMAEKPYPYEGIEISEEDREIVTKILKKKESQEKIKRRKEERDRTKEQRKMYREAKLDLKRDLRKMWEMKRRAKKKARAQKKKEAKNAAKDNAD